MQGLRILYQRMSQDALSVSDFVNEKGYNTVQVDETKCVACGMCYRVCPDYVFEIR